MKKRRVLIGLSAGFSLLLAIGGAVSGLQRSRDEAQNIPTTFVKRGTLELRAYATGELRPVKSTMLVAPPVNGTLQIVRMTKTGTPVKAGESVVEFDPSEQEYNLEQSRSELLQSEQEITRMRAQAAVSASEDRVALLKARFDVRRAELEVGKNELLSAIDGQKNLLNLDEAKRRLAQLEEDVRSRVASNQASIAVLEEKRNKSQLEMRQAQRAIESMRLKSPMAGLVSVKENRDATGGFFTTGMVLPDYREGDIVFPGRFIAEVLGVEEMEIQAKVNENDRASLGPGQAVEVKVDAIPGKTFDGKVKNVAGLASRSFFGGDGTRRFDATFTLKDSDPRLRSGTTVRLTILGEQVKDALYLPRQAIFEKEGKSVAFVRKDRGFEAREVKVVHRTESRVVIEGLKEGSEAAIVDPGERKKPGGPSLSGPLVTGGGR